MANLEKNRVYDIEKIETLKSSAETLLDTGINCAKAWDESIETLRSLLAESPVTSQSLNDALAEVETLYQEKWDMEKEWIGNALSNAIINIPNYDMQAAGLLDSLMENLTLIKGMTEDLAGCIEAAGTELKLSEFNTRLETVRQDWEATSFEENIEEYETSYLGMVENTVYLEGITSNNGQKDVVEGIISEDWLNGIMKELIQGVSKKEIWLIDNISEKENKDEVNNIKDADVLRYPKPGDIITISRGTVRIMIY